MLLIICIITIIIIIIIECSAKNVVPASTKSQNLTITLPKHTKASNTPTLAHTKINVLVVPSLRHRNWRFTYKPFTQKHLLLFVDIKTVNLPPKAMNPSCSLLFKSFESIRKKRMRRIKRLNAVYVIE
jgi:hypothetical protein